MNSSFVNFSYEMSIRSKCRLCEYMTSVTNENKGTNKLPIKRTTLKRVKKTSKKRNKVKTALDTNIIKQTTIQRPAHPSSEAAANSTGEQEERELEAEAIRLILLETQRAKERVDTMGATGWSQSRIPRINKQFVKQVVGSALAANNYINKEKKL